MERDACGVGCWWSGMLVERDDRGAGHLRPGSAPSGWGPADRGLPNTCVPASALTTNPGIYSSY